MSDMTSSQTQQIPVVQDQGSAGRNGPEPARGAPGYPAASPGAAAHTREIPVVQAPVDYAATPLGPAAYPSGPPVGPAPETLQAHGQAWARPTGGSDGKMRRLLRTVRYSPVWLAPVALAACFAVAGGFVLATNPTNDLGPSTCAFKLVTGFACPGCGGTRAFYFFLTLDIPEAARNHAIAVFAAPFLIYLYVSWAQRRVFPKMRRKLPKFQITPTMAVSFLMAWGAFWVLRNLPWAPFTALYA